MSTYLTSVDLSSVRFAERRALAYAGTAHNTESNLTYLDVVGQTPRWGPSLRIKRGSDCWLEVGPFALPAPVDSLPQSGWFATYGCGDQSQDAVFATEEDALWWALALKAELDSCSEGDFFGNDNDVEETL